MMVGMGVRARTRNLFSSRAPSPGGGENPPIPLRNAAEASFLPGDTPVRRPSFSRTAILTGMYSAIRITYS